MPELRTKNREKTLGKRGEKKKRATIRRKKEKDENRETVLMTLSKTVKNLRSQRNNEEEEIIYPEMPRPDVPRDIEEQTLSDSFKNIPNEEEDYK